MNPRLSVLSQDNYQEKLAVLTEARETAVAQWRAHHVLAWLEIEMNMPLYGKTCAENIKSGKVNFQVKKVMHLENERFRTL